MKPQYVTSKFPTARRQRPELILQRSVIQHLSWRGVPRLFFFHVPLGGWRSRTEAAIFAGLGTISGVPDLILIYCGRVYGLELKPIGGRKPSPTQLATHERMRAAGALVATAVGIDQALDQLTKWGLLRTKTAPP